MSAALERIARLRCERPAGQARPGAARIAPRVPRRGRARVPHPRPAGAHALRRRGAARRTDDRARRRAHGDALRPRRADGGPPPDGRARARSGDARARARGQHGAGGRARAGRRSRLRSRRRDGTGRGTARREHLLRRHAGGARRADGLADGTGLEELSSAAARPTPRDGLAVGSWRARAQPASGRRGLSARVSRAR